MKHHIIQVSQSALIATMFFAAPVSAQAIRPAVGEPLVAAQKLASVRDYKSAMAQIEQADAVPNKTPKEVKIIALLRQYVQTVSDPFPERTVIYRLQP